MSLPINAETEPKSADEFLQELLKPESRYRKELNAAQNAAAAEKIFIEMICCLFELQQVREEYALNELIKEARTANAEKFPDILAPVLVPPENLTSAVAPTPTQREILKEQLQICATHLEALDEEREILLAECQETWESLLDTMVQKAEETPLTREDGEVVDVRDTLNKATPIEETAKRWIESAITAEKNRAQVSPPSAPPVKHHAAIQDKAVLFVRNAHAMNELRLIYAATHSDSPNLPDIDTGLLSAKILKAAKNTKIARTNIMPAPSDEQKYNDCLGNLISIEIDRYATLGTVKEINQFLKQFPEAKREYRP